MGNVLNNLQPDYLEIYQQAVEIIQRQNLLPDQQVWLKNQLLDELLERQMTLEVIEIDSLSCVDFLYNFRRQLTFSKMAIFFKSIGLILLIVALEKIALSNMLSGIARFYAADMLVVALYTFVVVVNVVRLKIPTKLNLLTFLQMLVLLLSFYFSVVVFSSFFFKRHLLFELRLSPVWIPGLIFLILGFVIDRVKLSSLD